MVSKATLAHKVRELVNNIPSDITTAMIENYIEDASLDVTNYTGESIDLDDIPSRYQGILKNLGAAYLRSRLTGVGVDFNITQGEFTISRGKESDAHAQQIQFHIDRANQSLQMLGRKVKYNKVFG